MLPRADTRTHRCMYACQSINFQTFSSLCHILRDSESRTRASKMHVFSSNRAIRTLMRLAVSSSFRVYNAVCHACTQHRRMFVRSILFCTCKARMCTWNWPSKCVLLPDVGVGTASVHYGCNRRACVVCEWHVRARARRTLQWPRNLHQGRGAGPVAALRSQSRMGFEQNWQQGQHVRL